jgi:hypothetical protein
MQGRGFQRQPTFILDTSLTEILCEPTKPAKDEYRDDADDDVLERKKQLIKRHGRDGDTCCGCECFGDG